MDEQPSQPTGTPPEPRLSRRASWIAMGSVALALGLLWAASDLSEPPPDEETLSAIQEMDAIEDAKATGRVAPLNYTVKDMNGADVHLASFKGKVILFNFWATWCGPCKVEIPDLVSLQEQYRDDLVVLGVLVQDDMNAAIPSFASQYKINYPILDGNDREDVESAYGPFWGIPSSVIVGPDGRIAQKHSGIRSREQFEREIAALLPEEDASSE